MLPMQLLRVSTRKGAIKPLYCTESELDLAARIIKDFGNSLEKRETRGQLEKRVAALESSSGQGSDFKLVRGLYALLERKCTFASEMLADSNGRAVEPSKVRKAVFEESSRRGFALTDLERKEIALSASATLGLEFKPDSLPGALEKAMFCDFEENHIFRRFDAISPEELLGWYNLSLMQTLLFNCTKIEFSVSGGQAWKRALRTVKWLGLMYSLEEREKKDSPIEASIQAAKSTARLSSQSRTGESQSPSHSGATNHSSSFPLVCTLDGPLSLFRMTDRYGTSVAKLLPDIVRSEQWSVDAWVVRKTMSGKKLYEFHASDSDAPRLLFEPCLQWLSAGSVNKEEDPTTAKKRKNTNAQLFDSAVEEKFASKVAQSSLPESGWALIREPDPLVVPGGGVFIPDFVFEKNGRKVYLEIVGFWTKEYLEKKTRKIAELVGNAGSLLPDTSKGRPLEIFIAINEDLACSKIASSIPKERLIFYRNDSVPIGPIVDYLKSIDRELILSKVNDPELRCRIESEIADSTLEIIPIQDIAKRHSIPLELAVELLRKNEDTGYIFSGNYLISKSKVQVVKDMLEGISKFAEASLVLSANSIPEACHAELLDKLGYQVVWKSMEPESAYVVRRGEKT